MAAVGVLEALGAAYVSHLQSNVNAVVATHVDTVRASHVTSFVLTSALYVLDQSSRGPGSRYSRSETVLA